MVRQTELHAFWGLLQQWGRVPALNTNATFIDDLAAMVLEKLPSAAPRPGYTPSLNETMNLGPPTGAPPPPDPGVLIRVEMDAGMLQGARLAQRIDFDPQGGES